MAAALLLFALSAFGDQADGRRAAEAPSAEAAFRLAGAEFRAADYSRARDLYTKILLDSPRSPFVRDSLFFLAECNLVLGNGADAEKRYHTVLSLYPDSPYREASTFRLADVAWREKRASRALFQLDVLQQQFPDGAYRGNALCMAADIHFDQKDFTRALAEYDGAISWMKEGPGKQSAWYSRGLTQLAQGMIADAEESFAVAAGGSAGNVAERASFQRALLLAGAGNHGETALALTAFLNRFPASAETEKATVLLASLLEKSGDTQGALTRWDSLVKGFPGSDSLPEYLYKKGGALLALARSSEALDYFQAVVKRFPRSPWNAASSYAIGYVYTRRAEYPRALPYFQAAARDAPAGELAERSSLSMGICLFNMGSFDMALVRLEDLRSRKPKSISEGAIVVLIGRTLYRMGRLEDAVLTLREVATGLAAEVTVDQARAAENGADAAYWLGWTNLRLGRLAPARDAFLAVAREFPSDTRRVESLLRAAICETMRADDPAAVALFDEVIQAPRSGENDDARGQALYEEGRAFGRMGRLQESKDACERLALEYPGGKLAAQAFFKLAEQALAGRSYGEAEAGFQRVARDFPRSGLGPQALYWRARALWESGDSRGALDGFWDCLVHGVPSALLTTATDDLRAALRATGDLALARQFADRATGSRGLALEAAAGIQLEYARMLLLSDPVGALAVIQEVGRGAPPEPLAGEASLLQGSYFAAIGDWRRAVDVFSALESTRDDEIGARAMGEHGQALEATGRTAEAVDEYLKIASHFPDFQDLAAEGLYNAGRVAGARGDVDRAAKIREALRKGYPRSPWVQKLEEAGRSGRQGASPAGVLR